MEKEFVPYELAVKLKALGFDESCFGYYEDNNLTITFPSTSSNGWKWVGNSIIPAKNTKAPLYQQAFRWFRDKNFHAKIESYHSLGKHKPFGLSIDYLHESGKWTYIDHGGDFDFQTHEEAQERAIEIIIGILEK
jgi:hypothetical protein